MFRPLTGVSVFAATALLSVAPAFAASPTSVTTTFQNNTNCTLTLAASGVSPGEWVTPPPKTINQNATFKAASGAAAGGVSGAVTYKTSNCTDTSLNGLNAAFIFENYPEHDNQYSTIGTSPHLKGEAKETKGGNDSEVTVTYSPRS